MTYKNYTNSISPANSIARLGLLIVLLLLFAATALITLLGVTVQAGMTLGLTGSAVVGFIPDETIPNACETIYNCKPAEAVLMERGYIIEK